MDAEAALQDKIASFAGDPLGYVMFNFPWNSEPSIQKVKLPEKYRARFPNCEYGPGEWACAFLEQLGVEIRKRGFNLRDAVAPIRFSTASGHGIGKTMLVALLVKFILDTRPLSKGTVTANTAEQLKTKTWAEIGKWHHLSLTSHWFDYSAGRGAMSLVYKDRKLLWRCDAQTCREENSESFAGQHAPNGSSFYIFDEASAIPEKIFEVREGGTVTGSPMIFDFGNPTRKSGRFFENSIGKFANRYIVRTIDSREAAITNKKQIDEWIQDYGLDSDFVKVRVLGQFPSAGSAQFIASEDVLNAGLRLPVQDRTAPLVIGVDVARFGEDSTVIYPRIGNDAQSWPIKQYKGLNTVQVTSRIIETIKEFKELGLNCAGLFIDGGNIGGAVIDQLRHLGYAPHDVGFGNSPVDGRSFRYRGDEIWGRMRDSLYKRLCIPGRNTQIGEALYDQLTQREFGYTQQGQKIHLESKDDMKSRGIASPDIADALALTFAMDVAPLGLPTEKQLPMFSNHEFDPYESRP